MDLPLPWGFGTILCYIECILVFQSIYALFEALQGNKNLCLLCPFRVLFGTTCICLCPGHLGQSFYV